MTILDRLRRRRPASPADDRVRTAAAKRELERVRKQWPDVLKYAASVTEHGQRNHFSDLIAGIYKGSR